MKGSSVVHDRSIVGMRASGSCENLRGMNRVVGVQRSRGRKMAR